MSRLALLAVLLAAVPAATAQDALPPSALDDLSPTRGQRVVVGLFTLAGGVAVPLTLWGGSTSSWGSDARRAVLVGSAPLGMAAGTVVGVKLLGLEPIPFGEALGDAALGYAAGAAAAVLVGYGVGYGLHYATGQGDYDFISPAVGGLAGLSVGLPLMLNLSTRSVEAAPSVLATPDGERAVGMTLRVSL